MTKFTNKLVPVAFSLLILALPAVLHPHQGRPEEPVWQSTFFAKDGQKPDPLIWSYVEGGSGWGNHELEFNCAYGSKSGPCDPAAPNSFVGTDNYLHIVAGKTADNHYTSARLITKDLTSFQYGRVVARIRIPSGRGVWPAFWHFGADDDVHHWPACGEMDVLESIGKEPNIIHGSIHGPGFPGPAPTISAKSPESRRYSAGFHTFGVTWEPGSIAYYVDDPRHPYAIFTRKHLPLGAVWLFDYRRFYLLLNVAVGGNWPGAPDAFTAFPAEMLVEEVKVWKLK